MSKNLSPAVTLTREQKEQRRLAAAEELLEGEKNQAQIARDHGVTRATVSQWRLMLEEEGIEGLKSTTDEGNQGPDPQLDEQDREQLVKLLEEGAQAHGWETDLCALGKHVVGESEDGSNDVFESFSTRFAKDSPPEVECSEIRREFVL